MNSSQVIANYESLSALTGQMREAAMRDEWDSADQHRASMQRTGCHHETV